MISLAVPFIDINKIYNHKPEKWNFDMHTHDEYELYCFLSGGARFYIEGTVYSLMPNDIIIVKRGELHSLLITESIPYRRVVTNFNAEAILGQYRKEIVEALNTKPLGKYNRYAFLSFSNKNWTHYIEEMLKTDNLNRRRLYLTLLLSELIESRNKLTSDTPVENILEGVISYINRHLSDPLNLDFLSEKFQLSKTHLNRKFKDMMGITVGKYICKKRLLLANELIAKKENPTSIFEKCGFKDYSSFYKAYINEFGISPREYKKQNTVG